MRNDTDAPDLRQALDMAAGIFSSTQGGASASPTPPSPEHDPAPLPSNEELADRLAKMMADRKNENTAAPTAAPSDSKDPSETSGSQAMHNPVEGLATVLPSILQALSGSGDLVKPEKLNLVRAFQPYLSNQRSPGVDRAIRMANVALAAKSALSVLGR